MDDQVRRTLVLIETSSEGLPTADRGRQLILVVRDYLDADELLEARRVLRLIEPEYFGDYMFIQVFQERAFSEAVARIIEVFGYGFWLLAKPAASA